MPNSRITDVSLFWTERDVDGIALMTVTARAQSAAHIITVYYESHSWNARFIRLAASHLLHLEVLEIDYPLCGLSMDEEDADYVHDSLVSGTPLNVPPASILNLPYVADLGKLH